MDIDKRYPYNFMTNPFVFYSLRGHCQTHFISAFVDHSIHHATYLHSHGSLAIRDAFTCMSKLAGPILCLISSTSSTSNLTKKISGINSNGSNHGTCRSSSQAKHITSIENAGFRFSYRVQAESATPLVFNKISRLVMKLLHREGKVFQSFPMFMSAAMLVPPLDNLSSKVLSVPLENTDLQQHGSLDKRPCEVNNGRCGGLSLPELNCARHTVEPRTGIEFPTVLDTILAGDSRSTLTSEVLVGTGSKIMKIVKIKSLKVYAFGFYVHPNSICEKLSQKYASLQSSELNDLPDLYRDLLREDISMSVRLVINCNGMKINTVKDSLEKSLRARLQMTNPDTNYQCLSAFGSCFRPDIPLPAGTTINFHQTADGQLVTEIGGNQVGAVRSKDLCRAFFGMYIGDVPVSEQTKEEIGRNVANIIGRC